MRRSRDWTWPRSPPPKAMHATRILREDVCDRSDDGEAPMELPERTETIIRSHDWLTRGEAAS
jgi:hypothetical protein